jgi:hypothetical protein
MATAADPLARARVLTRLLDSAIRVPGTKVRLGLDPLIGLIPGIGDLAGAALSGHLVLLGARLGAPRTVLVRMLANVAIDTVGGMLPVLGDLFDVGWKANSRNLALLEQHLDQPVSTARASRALVLATVLALALLAVAGGVVAVLVVRVIAGLGVWRQHGVR